MHGNSDEEQLEPIPETVEALQELTRLGDESVARNLLRITREIKRIVPEVVGVSVSLRGDLTFTMAATSEATAQLDGVQYLAGGPCELALQDGEAHNHHSGDVTDEDRWRLFVRAAAAAGVESTLSLPILHDGVVVAGINMYASTPSAFEGHHQELADACGAWAGGVVTNADMGFTTRFQAADAARHLRAATIVDQAVGALMSDRHISSDEAEARLKESAQRAGISDDQMARAVLAIFTPVAIGEDDDADRHSES